MRFKVDGQIIGKQRPRTNFRTGVIYTPKKTKTYEKQIAEQIDTKVDGAIAIDLECHFAMPKVSKKKRAEMMGKPCLKKPDTDNIIKVFLDAMNKKVFEDDKQVFNVKCTKIWDESEYVLVTILGENDIITERKKEDV